jgi:hypothetical protein
VLRAIPRLTRPAIVFLVGVVVSFQLIGCGRNVEIPAAGSTDSPVVSDTANSKTGGIDNVPQNEASITALQLFKKGETKIYRVDHMQVPNATPLPNIYIPLGATYKVVTKAIFSEAVITVHVPASSEDQFSQSRLLRLREDDMFPDGHTWQDCTVHDERLGKQYLPDLANKTVSCSFYGGEAPGDMYFCLTSQTGQIRKAPLTRIEIKLDRTEKRPSENQMIYTLSVANAGSQDVGEINFDSTFSVGVALSDVQPGKGACRRARFGNSESSIVCHLGELKRGEKTTIQFVAEPLRGPGAAEFNEHFNENWSIRGFSRKGPDDVVAPVDQFSVKPLTKKK